jgi:predicted DCC family thiol-disulfide oxidoreductase YuxK
MAHPILLYDGVCGLCNRLVQFILRNDHEGEFRFAALQSPVAARLLARHGVQTTDLDTVYVVVNPDPANDGVSGAGPQNETLLFRSDAIIFVLKQLGGTWQAIALSFQLLPRFLRDACYNGIARHRYRIFGRSDVCTFPSDQHLNRFLDR